MRMDELKEPATEVVRDGKREVHARALGPRVRRLDGEPASLVHQPPALVGPPAAGLVLRERARHVAETEPRGCPDVRLGRAHAARPTCSTPGSARRCGRSPPGAGRTRPPTSPTSTHEPAQHGARDHLPVGGAHGDDGPRVHRRRPVPRCLHPLGDPGRRRAAHEQEPGHRHRPARDDREVRRRRDALRPAAHEQHPGRALQRREDRHGPQLRQQALERGAARAAGERGRTRPSAARLTRSTAGSRAASSAASTAVEAAVAATTSPPPSTRSTTSSGTSSATGTSSSSRCGCTARTRCRRRRPPGTRAGCSTRSCACCTPSCRSSPRRSRPSTAPRRCSSGGTRCATRPLLGAGRRGGRRRAAGGRRRAAALPRRGGACRRARSSSAVFVGDGRRRRGRALRAATPRAVRALARTEVRFDGAPDGRRHRRAGAAAAASRSPRPWSTGPRRSPPRAAAREGRGRGAARRGEAGQRGLRRPALPRPSWPRSARSSPATSPTATGSPRGWRSCARAEAAP